MKKLGFFVVLLLAVGVMPASAAPTPPPQAKGVLLTATGATLGTVLFTQGLDGTVFVSVAVKDAPQGDHGLTIRETGACAADFSSVGPAISTDLPALSVSGPITELSASTKTFAVVGGSGTNLLDADGSVVVITANQDENAKIACAVLAGVPGPSPAAEAATATSATVELMNTAGEMVGSGTFSQNDDGSVRVQVRVSGLPAGAHGIHVHQFGQCQPVFGAAGEHHNPANAHHGPNNPESPKPHSGDLPNLMVNADGTGTLDTTTSGFTIKASDTTILDSDGSTLVIHANADDEQSDPSGKSGTRIACGVVQAATVAQPPATAAPAPGAPAATAVPGAPAATAVPGAPAATAVPATPAAPPAGGPGQLPNTGGPAVPWMLLILLASVVLATGVITRRTVRR